MLQSKHENEINEKDPIVQEKDEVVENQENEEIKESECKPGE